MAERSGSHDDRETVGTFVTINHTKEDCLRISFTRSAGTSSYDLAVRLSPTRHRRTVDMLDRERQMVVAFLGPPI